MSRKRYRLRDEAEERWPTLVRFFVCYCNEDWPEFYGSPEKALDAAVADYPFELRQTILKEWRDWMSSVGIADDIRALVNDGLGVNVHFEQPIEARQFMNTAYDKLIVSVRQEAERNWKPDWKR